MARRTLNEIRASVGPVGWFVRSRRRKLAYSQEEFALRVGVGLRFIRDLEQGKPSLRMDKVNQVLNYLGAELAPQMIIKEDQQDDA